MINKYSLTIKNAHLAHKYVASQIKKVRIVAIFFYCSRLSIGAMTVKDTSDNFSEYNENTQLSIILNIVTMVL